ncbi:MAG TPA: hypothetical protein VE011_11290 [Candidatus Dormibacteraeota bacterium]|nr:hypothetical protein [Candidatus Dormibacteraeota bacterium]
MKLDRFRAPALAATAVLLISGAGIAFASSPPATPAVAGPVLAAETAGPDTDTLQQGDQTTPDTAADTATAGDVTDPAADTATAGDVTDPAEATVSESASDGPGGHQDAAGQNVDHQFDGQE